VNRVGRVFAGLALERLARLQNVAQRGPGMSGPAGHFVVTEVLRGRSAMAGRNLELGGGSVIQLRGRLERRAQFQTLTSR
jgi:hypothetical protein